MTDPAGMVLVRAAARHVHDPAADFIALRIGTRQMASDHLRYRTEDPADQPRQTGKKASRATAQDRQEVFIAKILQVHELRDCRQKDRTIVTAGRACCGQRTHCWPGTTSPGSPQPLKLAREQERGKKGCGKWLRSALKQSSSECGMS